MTYSPGAGGLLDLLTDKPVTVDTTPPPDNTYRWATVASINPLTVRLDGDSAPLAATPDTLVALGDMKPGDRVWTQFYNRRAVVLGTSGTAPGSGAQTMRLMQLLMSGGGVRSCTGTGVGWSQRFILMGSGANDLVPDGYYNIDMPPDGTVIPVHSSAAETVTVAGGIIPLVNWQALYYEIPLGQGFGSAAGNFHVVYYFGGDDFQVPANWVLVAVRNGDSRAAAYRWGDGRVQDYWRALTLQNGWTAYGSGWVGPAYKVLSDGRVLTRGLIKGGTSGSTTPCLTFPVDLAPESGNVTSGLMFNQLSNLGQARVDVHADGTVCVVAYYNGGSNTFVTLDNMSWFPNGA